jgi:hypothetical protein
MAVNPEGIHSRQGRKPDERLRDPESRSRTRCAWSTVPSPSVKCANPIKPLVEPQGKHKQDSPLRKISEAGRLNFRGLPLQCSRGTPRLVGLGLLAGLQSRERVLRLGEIGLDP